jgi:hypothetical protein
MIAPSTQTALENQLARYPAGLRAAVAGAATDIMSSALPLAGRISNNRSALCAAVTAILLDRTRAIPLGERQPANRALVAHLALGLPTVVGRLNLPASILALYPAAMERLSGYLAGATDTAYDCSSDFFQKDLEFVLGLSVPCGAQVVDLQTHFLWRSVARALTRPGNTSAIRRLLLVGGRGPWFGIHTESRHLDDFNETGWDQCYLRIAELLKHRHQVRGMMGSSWFYDPQLRSVSPRLAYLQQKPMERGAFLIRHGTSPIDIERATLTSKTRRSLYEEGKYRPISYTLVWPRNQLISWAKTMA